MYNIVKDFLLLYMNCFGDLDLNLLVFGSKKKKNKYVCNFDFIVSEN